MEVQNIEWLQVREQRRCLEDFCQLTNLYGRAGGLNVGKVTIIAVTVLLRCFSSDRVPVEVPVSAPPTIFLRIHIGTRHKQLREATRLECAGCAACGLQGCLARLIARLRLSTGQEGEWSEGFMTGLLREARPHLLSEKNAWCVYLQCQILENGPGPGGSTRYVASIIRDA